MPVLRLVLKRLSSDAFDVVAIFRHNENSSFSNHIIKTALGCQPVFERTRIGFTDRSFGTAHRVVVRRWFATVCSSALVLHLFRITFAERHHRIHAWQVKCRSRRPYGGPAFGIGGSDQGSADKTAPRHLTSKTARNQSRLFHIVFQVLGRSVTTGRPRQDQSASERTAILTRSFAWPKVAFAMAMFGQFGCPCGSFTRSKVTTKPLSPPH
jgi:hypothetical protein